MRAGILGILAGVLALGMAAPTLRAEDVGTIAEARSAFESGDFGLARKIWRDLAAAGDREAAFQLGLISDLGLGEAPDPLRAYYWYLQSARSGHAAAQFNVGVMLDAGTGVPRGQLAAATWYARSAANGFPRAQYNLGLLYADGDGLPRNVELARAWMKRAADTLPAARERLAELHEIEPEAARPLVAPTPITAAVVRTQEDGGRALELVWIATEQPPGTRFRVEFVSATGDPGTVRAEEVDVSSITIPLSPLEPGAWRVLAVDRTHHRYAASTWQPLSGAGGVEQPSGQVAIRFGSDDARARALAIELADDFARSGFGVETAAAADGQIAESEVRYFFENDASLAAGVASALPVLDGHAVFQPDAAREPGTAPGTVEVRLHGGPAL